MTYNKDKEQSYVTHQASGRKRLAAIVAGTVMSAASLLGASLARASTTITRQSAGRTTTWSEIATSTDDTLGFNDATLTNPAGTLGRTDAFDDALEVYILPASDTDSTLSDTVTIDSPATVIDNSPNGGSVSGTGSANVNGTPFSVDWTLEFSSSEARVDGTFIVTNTSGAPFDGFVGVYSNFGSDDTTVVELTSSGDATIADGDTWVVTSEGGGEANGDDPVVLSVISNANALIGPDTDINSSSDNLVWRVPVSLAAGASTTITASHCIFETIAEAEAAGMTGVCAPGNQVPVPTMQNPALLALAILTGLLGTGSLLRRRKIAGG